MARPLEYKPRVRLPAELPLHEPRPERHLDVRFWGVLVWLGSAAVAYSISARAVPLSGWLHGAAGVADEVTAPRDDSAPLQTTPPAAAVPTPTATPAMATATARAITAADTTPTGVQAAAALAPSVATRDPAEATPRARETTDDAPSNASDDLAVAPLDPGLTAKAEPAFHPPPPPEHARTFKAGMSCESASAAYSDQVSIGGPQGPADLTRGQFASVLENGSWFSWCHVPASFSVNVCVAVKDGKTVGATVRTGPRSYKTEACIEHAAWRLRFPSNPRLDVTRTVFEAD